MSGEIGLSQPSRTLSAWDRRVIHKMLEVLGT